MALSPDPALTVADVTDAALVVASRTDPETFAELFDRHAPRVHRYLARRLGAQAAADLVGETFLIAFRRRDRYDATRLDALPWLYGIVTTLVGQHRREEARRHRLHLALPPAIAEPFPALKLPGITVLPDARDGAGRPGVGVSWTYAEGPAMRLVFDPVTYELLGTGDDALQRRVVVDRAGQRR